MLFFKVLMFVSLIPFCLSAIIRMSVLYKKYDLYFPSINGIFSRLYNNDKESVSDIIFKQLMFPKMMKIENEPLLNLGDISRFNFWSKIHWVVFSIFLVGIVGVVSIILFNHFG